MTRETFEPTIRADWQLDRMQLESGTLVVENGSSAGQRAMLGKEGIVIGRAVGNQLVLNDPLVSATHAELMPTAAGPELRDLESTNGIVLAGHRVSTILLHHGSRFVLGETHVRFEGNPTQPIDVALSKADRFGELYGQSLPMRQLFAVLERVAPSQLTVLITGETGTGKELCARSIHEMSLRANRPFLVLDCGSVARELVESTLFGHEEGAFTGAIKTRKGIFEEAAGGTVFLDEIGDMDLDLQRRLLRVLEAREVTRVGSHHPIAIDVRVVAATHQDLRKGINRGVFREDLYFRLAQVQVTLPPLRDRLDDIEGLIAQLLEQNAQWLEHTPRAIAPRALDALRAHHWPGNVRELRNTLSRAISLARGEQLTLDDLSLYATAMSRRVADLAVDIDTPFKEAKANVIGQFERAYLKELMKRHDGNLTHASRHAELARNHLRALLKQRGVLGRGD
jgi:DNA-binding NtrC family response regulator